MLLLTRTGEWTPRQRCGRSVTPLGLGTRPTEGSYKRPVKCRFGEPVAGIAALTLI